MTARQRAKREKELGEDEGLIDDGLLSLPDGLAKVKPILTEAERLQKREEMARRRKRQNEQRLQDEQVGCFFFTASRIIHVLHSWRHILYGGTCEGLIAGGGASCANGVEKLTRRTKRSTACCVRKRAARAQS